MKIPQNELELTVFVDDDYTFFPDADPANKERDEQGKIQQTDRSLDEQLLTLCVPEERVAELFEIKKNLNLTDFNMIAVCFGVKEYPELESTPGMWMMAVIQMLCWVYPKRKATVFRYASGTIMETDFKQLESKGRHGFIMGLYSSIIKPLAELVAMMPPIKEHEDPDRQKVMERLQGVVRDYDQIAEQYQESLERDHGQVLRGISYVENDEGEITGFSEDDLTLELVDIGAGGDDKNFVDLRDEAGEERSLGEVVCEECDVNVVLKDKYEAYCPVCERIFLSKRGVSDLECEDCGKDLLYIGTNESYCPHCDRIFSKMTAISGIQDAVKRIEG